jgi:activating signal cointegrator complex subunit 2
LENENSSGRGFGRDARRGDWNHGNSAEEDGPSNIRQQGFGRGARQGDRNLDHLGEANEDHDSAQGFALGGPGPRGGGGRRGGRNHNRRDRAMKKHMQGMTGL